MKAHVLDASALLAFAQKGEGAEKVGGLLKNAVHGQTEIFMSAVNYAEVYAVLLREYGTGRTAGVMSALQPLPIRVIDATLDRALRAAEVKTQHKLHFVDAFAAALAIECQAKLVTSDSDFRKMGHNFPIAWL